MFRFARCQVRSWTQKNRAPSKVRDRRLSLKSWLAGSAFQYLDSLVQLIVLGAFRLCLGLGGSRLLAVVIGNYILYFVGYQHIRSDRGFLNRLPARRIVFRHGENQRPAVRRVDFLLHRPVAEGLVAYHVAASILEDRRRHNLSRTCSSFIH